MNPVTPKAASPDRILLFIPAYNCASQIERVLVRLASLRGMPFAEILILDNRSKDDTVKTAVSTAARLHLAVRVARNRENFGLGGSHKAAFAYAAAEGFTHLAVLHGDDQGSVEDLLPILNAGLHRSNTCCLGSRFMRGASLHGYSRFRIAGNYVFNALFSLVSGRIVRDLGSGLNIFNVRQCTTPELFRYSDDLRFNCYFLLGLIDQRASFIYFPISWREDDQVSNVKMFSQSLRTLKIALEYLLARPSFRHADHRDVHRIRYAFDVVHEISKPVAV